MSGTRKMDRFDASGGTRRTDKLAPDAVADDAADSDAVETPKLPFQASSADGPSEPSLSGPLLEEGAAGPGDADAREVPPAFATVTPQSVATPPVEAAEASRTNLARKFVDLAESVTAGFADFTIGSGAWGVELTAPQGMSTGGGKQALQHLRMRPRRDGYAVLVVGTVSQIEKRADLRDFDHVAILHEVRYGKTLELSSVEWEQFLWKAEVVLNGAGIQSMRTPPPRELLDQRRSMQRISKRAVVTLVVVLLLASVVLWRVVAALLEPR